MLIDFVFVIWPIAFFVVFEGNWLRGGRNSWPVLGAGVFFEGVLAIMAILAGIYTLVRGEVLWGMWTTAGMSLLFAITMYEQFLYERAHMKIPGQ